ncbi:MAG: hypothetical protein IPK97_09135 [Ahniella sp.]|nr:hypothetical protein [Ahniella sp.]
MRIRPKNLMIPDGSPFQYDVLSRKKTADSLTELVKSSIDGLVLSLHAPWGFGKTTFLSMWRKQLHLDGFRTLYFNAWESDFSDDALVALIGEFGLVVTEFQRQLDPTEFPLEEQIAKVKKIGGKLIRRAIPAAIRIASAGLLDTDDFLGKSLAEVGEKFAESEIQRFEESKRTMASFKSQIELVAREFSALDQSGVSRPIVIIVDELDRCRPDYAIRVLECIKHLFSVEGIVFVVAIDRTQLSHSVSNQYGAGMDSEGYRRLFDLELNLPEPTTEQFTDALFAQFDLDAYFSKREGQMGRYDRSQFKECFDLLFSSLQSSLRPPTGIFLARIFCSVDPK